MRRLTGMLVLFAMLSGAVFLGRAAWSAEEVPNLKVLIVTGGHRFDEPEFFDMFKKMPGVVYDRAILPGEMDRLAPGLEEQYDVLLCYDQNTFPLTNPQRDRFERLFQKGIAVVAVHHTLSGYREWTVYRNMIGGCSLFLPQQEIDGTVWRRSTFKDDLTLNIAVADREHPITKGLKDFTIVDEGYKSIYVRPDVHVLLTTDHPEATKQVAWTHRYGKSPVFTIVLGHGKEAYAHETYQTLLLRGIRWTAAQRRAIAAD